MQQCSAKGVAVRSILLGLVLAIGCGQSASDDSSDDGGSPVPVADSIGLFVPLNNYAALETADGDRRYHWGGESVGSYSRAVAGDLDGDGLDEVGLYELRLGVFRFARTNEHGAAVDDIAFQPLVVGEGVRCSGPGGGEPAPDLIPLVADLDGEGAAEPIVFDATIGTFHVRETDGSVTRIESEIQCAIPLAGDFDGDGQDELGVYEPASGRFVLDVDGARTEVTYQPVAGAPVAGDWNGDGIDTIGMVSATTPRMFHLRNSNDAGEPDVVIGFDDPVADAFVNSTSIVPLVGAWDSTGAQEAPPYAWQVGEADPTRPCLDPARLPAIAAAGAASEHLFSVLVACRGRLVVEEYFRGYDASIAANIKSVSKSVLSALFGAALDSGYFEFSGGSMLDFLRGRRLDVALGYDPVSGSGGYGRIGQGEATSFVPVSLFDMITMSAGLEWYENSPTTPNLGAMVVSQDWIGYVVGQSMTSPLGTFAYNTGMTVTGAWLLTDEGRRHEGDPSLQLDHSADRLLFDRLGIEVMRWDHDPNPIAGQRGPNAGGWEMWMRPRDLLRFGQLFAEGGAPGGERMLPAAWVAESTQALIPSADTCGQTASYGAWWRRSTFVDASGRSFDGFHGVGYGGQHVIVIPSRQLVVAMTSSTGGDSCTHVATNFALLKEQILPLLSND
jgi:CubicO group peptidase (beta-lactamase class C family)